MKRRYERYLLFLFVIVLVIGILPEIKGQDNELLEVDEEYGSISGIVTDPDNFQLPGITVILECTDNTTFKRQTTVTNSEGKYRFLLLPNGNYTLIFQLEGMTTLVRKGIIIYNGNHLQVDVGMTLKTQQESIVVSGKAPVIDRRRVSSSNDIFLTAPSNTSGSRRGSKKKSKTTVTSIQAPLEMLQPQMNHESNTNEFGLITENQFKNTLENPLSTLSIDVDTASYSLMRRYINENQLPPPDAVRIEELINYFTYDYPEPNGEHPFSVVTEYSECPWNTSHDLALIGLQGKRFNGDTPPVNNLVFLLDVSGSMDEPDKLPLLQSAFRLLIKELKETDRVSIVVYAGNTGLVLPSTPGNEKQKIEDAVNRLQAGGSTAGGAGIQLAYQIAMENFNKDGNNRVILATDGDFNVGISDTAELLRMIEKKRNDGIFLTVLGFGTGNLKDSRMEQLADKGNGNYYYIDNILEAQKVLVNQLNSTLFTIAKDVKIQIEFNPVKVKAYKLIGYENRLLNKEDFKDDTKDAGELGAGSTVTALYEIIPIDVKEDVPSSGELKYSETKIKDTAVKSKELLTVHLRYKRPKESESQLITHPLVQAKSEWKSASEAFRFAASVAEFGMVIRNSAFKGTGSLSSALKNAQASKGVDMFGYRAEFIQLVKKCDALVKSLPEISKD